MLIIPTPSIRMASLRLRSALPRARTAALVTHAGGACTAFRLDAPPPASSGMHCPVWRRAPTSGSHHHLRPLATRPPEAPSLAARLRELAPGVAAAAIICEAGFAGAEVLGAQLLALQGLTGASPISGIPVAILLGLGLKNSGMLSSSAQQTLDPGLQLCKTTVLQTGIVCIGAKLSAVDILTTGAVGVPAVMFSIGTGLTVIPWLGDKLGLAPRMSALIAAGCSICGVTAISALSPIIKANQQEISFAIANVVLFGTLGMLAMPYVAHELFPISQQAGIFLGLAVHDTAQVMGAALTYKEVFNDELVFTVAAVTKLTRNLFLAAVIPWLAWRTSGADSGAGGAGKKGGLGALMKRALPTFVLAFLGMAALRSAGDAMLAGGGSALGVLDAAQWKRVCSVLGNDIGSHACLGTAMAAVGCTTSLSVLRGVGPRPFILGAVGSLSVALAAFTSVSLLALGGFFPPAMLEKKQSPPAG